MRVTTPRISLRCNKTRRFNWSERSCGGLQRGITGVADRYDGVIEYTPEKYSAVSD
jgi:hypothetical protein